MTTISNSDEAELPICESIVEHANFCLSFWFPSTRIEGGQEMLDSAVMGMGIAGEALETLEAASLERELDLTLLLKELGDTLFYWCACAAKSGIPIQEAWVSSKPWRAKPHGRQEREAIERKAMAMAIASGRCSEAVKKMLRDGAGPANLAKALEGMSAAIAELCWACGFSLEEAALCNQEKLSSRKERGTLRGDGNHR